MSGLGFGGGAGASTARIQSEVSKLRQKPTPPATVVFDTLTGLTVTGTSATAVLDATHGQCIKATAAADNTVAIERNPCGIMSTSGVFALRFYVEDWTKINYISVYLSKDTSYTNWVLFTYNIAGIPGLQRNGWHEYRFGDRSLVGETTFTGGAFTLAETTIQRMKVHAAPVAGQSCSVFYKFLAANPVQPKATFLITSDDSYKSWYQYGVSYLDTLGLKSTLYNIASVLGGGAGDGAYMAASEVGAMHANGHDIAVHGAANLASLGDPGARMADIKSNRDYLMTNGYTRAANHYAWPNGVFEMSAGDMSLRDSLMSQGIVTARGTTRLTSSGGTGMFYTLPTEWRDCAGFMPDVLNLNIIGHDGTQDVGASQLAALQARIDRVVGDKATGILMFHKIGSSPVDSLHCPEADFRAIIDKINEYAQAGTAEVLTISQFYQRLNNQPLIGL